jgi:hypothetical protein
MIIKPDWTQPYLNYLLRETPSHGTKAEASCLAPHAKSDTVVRDELYKRGKSEIIEQFRCEDQGTQLYAISAQESLQSPHGAKNASQESLLSSDNASTSRFQSLT